MQRVIYNGDPYQSRIFLDISHCCLNALFCRGWFHVSRTYWNTALDFEHRVRQRRFRRSFAMWHNVEIYALHPTDREMFYVLSALPEWTGLEIICLFRLQLRLVYSY